MLDDETLRFIWWLLVGVLLIGFAVMDGHDMGVGTLLPFVGRSDVERRVVINTVGAHWDGNQVWFITAGGAVFAAWPLVYAAAFSGFYWAMLAALWALFLRPTGFDFRSKLENPRWRSGWDWGLFVGSAVPPLIFGVAFGNLLLGVPFHYDATLLPHYTGTFWQLLNPFALLCGVVSLSMITFHGANYLMHRTEGEIYRRARTASLVFGMLLLATFALAGISGGQRDRWLCDHFGRRSDEFVEPAGEDRRGRPGCVAPQLCAMAAHDAGAGLWHPRDPCRPAAGATRLDAGGIHRVLCRDGGSYSRTAAVLMFPFVMPSSSEPNSSLTVWDATSSQLTLGLMFWAVVLFMPLIIFYTRWAYGVMAGKVTAAYVQANQRGTY